VGVFHTSTVLGGLGAGACFHGFAFSVFGVGAAAHGSADSDVSEFLRISVFNFSDIPINKHKYLSIYNFTDDKHKHKPKPREAGEGILREAPIYEDEPSRKRAHTNRIRDGGEAEVNKLLLLPLLLLSVGGGLLAYGVVSYTITYTVTVRDTTTYAANIILLTPSQIAVDLNEGETATSTITLQNTGNASGSATLSTSGQLPAHFDGGSLTKTVTIPAGATLDVTLYIPAPTNVDSDTTYTVTVSVS
jgi:hypothetical protein